MTGSAPLALRAAGILAGFAAVVLVTMVAARPPAPQRHADVPVAIDVAQSGEAEARPAGRVVEGTVAPGDQMLTGTVDVIDQTGGRAELRPVLRGPASRSERALRITVASAGRTLYEGSLRGLRRGGKPVAVKGGKPARVDVSVTMGPRGVRADETEGGTWSLSFGKA